MEDAVVEVYIEALARRRDDPYYSKVLSLIGGVQEELGIRVRADAAYFLANTTVDLVIAPVLQAREVGVQTAQQISEGALLERAEMDLRAVLIDAVAHRDEDESNPISATSAIEALGRRVRELSLDDLTVWG